MTEEPQDHDGPPDVRESGCSLPENVLPSGTRREVPPTCPKCGAMEIHWDPDGYMQWACRTQSLAGRTVEQSPRCRIAELEQEVARLRNRLAECESDEVDESHTLANLVARVAKVAGSTKGESLPEQFEWAIKTIQEMRERLTMAYGFWVDYPTCFVMKPFDESYWIIERNNVEVVGHYPTAEAAIAAAKEIYYAKRQP